MRGPESYWEIAFLGPQHTRTLHAVLCTSLVNDFSVDVGNAYINNPRNTDDRLKMQVRMMQLCAACNEPLPTKCRVNVGVRIITGVSQISGESIAPVDTCIVCAACAKQAGMLTTVPSIFMAPDKPYDKVVADHVTSALTLDDDSVQCAARAFDAPTDESRMLAARLFIHTERCYDELMKDLRPHMRQVCHGCGAQGATQMCSACGIRRYCTETCATYAWRNGHKDECGAQKRARRIWNAAGIKWL